MGRKKILQFQQVGERLEWTWFLSAANGKTLARCSETHPRLSTAIRGAALVTGRPLLQLKTGEWVSNRPDIKVVVLR